jgi:hypothetical protein
MSLTDSLEISNSDLIADRCDEFGALDYFSQTTAGKSLFGLFHIGHLLKHELGGNSAHHLQYIAESRTDFQIARLDASDRLLDEYLHVHSFLPTHFRREFAPE